MKIIEMIDQQIKVIYNLDLRPKAIQIDESYCKQFNEECEQYIAIVTGVSLIDFEISKFRNLEIVKIPDGSAGFIGPIQVTIE